MSTAKCPHCNSIIAGADTLYCDMCGGQLKAPSVSSARPVAHWEPLLPLAGLPLDGVPPAITPAAARVHCPKCNTENPPDHKFCDRCGTKLV